MHMVEELKSRGPATVDAKAKQILEVIAIQAKHQPGESVVLKHETDYPLAYGHDEKALLESLDFLAQRGWIKIERRELATKCTLTVSGLQEVEQR